MSRRLHVKVANEETPRVVIVPVGVTGDLKDWFESLAEDCVLETEDGGRLLRGTARPVEELGSFEMSVDVRDLDDWIKRLWGLGVLALALSGFLPAAGAPAQAPLPLPDPPAIARPVERRETADPPLRFLAKEGFVPFSEEGFRNGLDRWIEEDPENAEAWVWKMIVLKSTGRDEEAEQAYEQLLRLDPPPFLDAHPAGLDEEELEKIIEAYEAHMKDSLVAEAASARQTDSVDRAVIEIAGAVGTDIRVLAPGAPREGVDYSDLVYSFAAWVGMQFLGGFLGHFKGLPKRAGEDVAKQLEDLVRKVFTRKAADARAEFGQWLARGAEVTATADPDEHRAAAEAGEISARESLVAVRVGSLRADEIATSTRRVTVNWMVAEQSG